MKNKKGFTLVEIMIVVVIIGLLAAMAIPAFTQVRENSRSSAIENNLRQVASAAQQFMLENGVTQAAYSDLTAAGYFSDIAGVNGEDYTALVINEDDTEVTLTDASGETRSFQF